MRPIEVNPLRFAGWCSTDIAYYAFGVNVYEYFMEKKRPNWDEIFMLKQGREFAIAVLEKRDPIKENLVFDYEKLTASLTCLVKLRPIDYRKLPLFAFLFLETSESNAQELDYLLTLDPHVFLGSM